MSSITTFKVKLNGRDWAELQLVLDANRTIVSSKLRASGCSAFLKLIDRYRPLFAGPVESILLPTGVDHASLLLRELILKAQNKWSPPYTDEEMCHCRMVETKLVCQAIVSGAHTPREVSRLTQASTQCGTCRPDVESMIEYILGKES